MKAFLLRVGIFAAVVLCLFGMGEWYVESRPNAARDKHKWMTRHSRDVQTLILGSSHTLRSTVCVRRCWATRLFL